MTVESKPETQTEFARRIYEWFYSLLPPDQRRLMVERKLQELATKRPDLYERPGQLKLKDGGNK